MKLSHGVAVAVLLLAGALGARAARASGGQSPDDSGMNLHQIYLPLDGHGFYVVDDSQTLDQWQVHGFLNYSHAYRPLVLSNSPDDARRGDVIDRMNMLDVGGSIGLLTSDSFIPGASVGFDIPINILDDGLQLPNLDRSIGSGGVGQLRLQLKADLLESKSEYVDFGLGLKPFVTLPTGRTRDELNDRDTATWGAMIMPTVRVTRIRLGFEAGYEFTPHLRLLQINIEDRLRWGMSLEGYILRDEAPWSDKPEETIRHTLAVGLELYGWAAVNQLKDERTRPAELHLYARYENSLGLLLRIAYGYGLDAGVSAPVDRFMVQIGWTF